MRPQLPKAAGRRRHKWCSAWVGGKFEASVIEWKEGSQIAKGENLRIQR